MTRQDCSIPIQKAISTADLPWDSVAEQKALTREELIPLSKLTYRYKQKFYTLGNSSKSAF